MNNYPLVSVVILNWNGLVDTLECIASVKKLDYPNVEIIVVDNGSRSDSVEALDDLDGIILSKLPRNTGFTGGHIEGLRHSRGDYILLLNNDLVVAKESLTILVEALIKNKAAIAGGKSYRWDADYPANLTSNPYYSYQVVNPITGHTLTCSFGPTLSEVNSISGSNLLVSRDLINHIGYLDPSFFAYYEETDLIARAKRAGYKVLYVPDAHVWHRIGASTRSHPYFFFYFMHRNRFSFAVKNYDIKYLLPFLAYYTNEFARSLRNYSRDKSFLYDKAMVNAWLYASAHLPLLLIRRLAVMRLGSTYSEKLLRPTEANQTVTVTIPCYNYADYVVDAIESAAQQTVKPAKIIIINDGSTDDSPDIIAGWLELNKAKFFEIQFEYINQPNAGIISTKNTAIELVDSDWHIFLDADDILDSSYIEKTMHLARTRNADLVYTDMQFFGSQDGIQKVCKYNKYRLRATNFIHNSALIRTSLLKRAGRYNSLMHMGYEDWELYLHISKFRPRTAYLEQPILQYRRHEGASRDVSAQQKMPLVVKTLEKLHPDLYNLRFYIWLETNRGNEALKEIIKTPFRITRHLYSHTIFYIDRRASTSKIARKAMVLARIVTGKRKEN